MSTKSLAGAIPDSEELGSIESARSKLVEKLPDLMDKAVELALEGNQQMLGKVLDIYRDMSSDSEARRTNEALDAIKEIRRAGIEEIRGLQSDTGGPPANMDAKGGAGVQHSDAPRETGDMEPPVDTTSTD